LRYQERGQLHFVLFNATAIQDRKQKAPNLSGVCSEIRTDIQELLPLTLFPLMSVYEMQTSEIFSQRIKKETNAVLFEYNRVAS